MYHQHFNSMGSTQIYLKENLEQLKLIADDILISCSEQTSGIGTKGNVWDTYPNSLAMSFTLRPNKIPSLTPIEIGLLAISYFKEKFHSELFLKWPNDLLTIDGKKCGGILCQYIDSTTVLVGLGVNLGNLKNQQNNNYRHGLGSVDQTLELRPFDQEQISRDLYQNFLENRYSDSETLKSDFNKYCYHMNMNVFIYENEKDVLGIFRGIGNNGEALVEIDSTIRPFFSSSLTILD